VNQAEIVSELRELAEGIYTSGPVGAQIHALADLHRVMPDLDDSIALLRYLCDALGIGPVAA
jgi:hypothetical protein